MHNWILPDKIFSLNDSTTNIIKLKYDAGQVTSLAIQQSEAQKLNSAQLIPLLEQNIAIQENALSVLTGSFPDSKERTIRLSSIEVKNNTRNRNSVFISKQKTGCKKCRISS